jgi:hypothetical protein
LVVVTLLALLSIMVSLYVGAPTLAVPASYEPAWSRIPERHRSLVQGIYQDRDSSAQARRATMTIHLKKRGGTPSSLWHEVGHLVRWSDNRRASDWDARFWPRGRLVGIAASAYARTSPSEDFAVSYEEIIEHGCLGDPDRDRFMKARVFRPGELPVPCIP